MSNSKFLQLIQEEIGNIVEKIGIREYHERYLFLEERISAPESYVVLLGETSSGKSSLINGLLKKDILVVGAQPTTGAVTEIMEDSSVEEFSYSVIYRNATEETIQKNDFMRFSSSPDEGMLRLRLYVNQFPCNLRYLRLFDTPGYNALQDYHEDVIRNFIPESDVIIYVVSYRAGFQKYDNDFVESLNELIDDSTELVLVINRAPDSATMNDNRVKEIVLHASDCLHRDLKPFIINSTANSQEVPASPKAPELWNHVSAMLSSEERMKRIHDNYLHFQKNFLNDISNLLYARLLVEESDERLKSQVLDDLSKLKEKQTCIHKLIEKRFQDIRSRIPGMVSLAREAVCERVKLEIYSVNKWTSMDETVAFINAHVLQFHSKLQIKNIADYIRMELELLDEEVNNELNTALGEFRNQIELKSSNVEKLVIGISSTLTQRLAGQSLSSYFAAFGGAGGAGAGVANASKAALKNIGNVFGKTFSRQTHNALAKSLSKIGATSSRAISGLAFLLVETALYIYEASTWQSKLFGKSEESLNDWRLELETEIQKQIVELEEMNHKELKNRMQEMIEPFELASESTDKIDKSEINFLLSKIESLTEEIDKHLNIN